MNTNDQRCIMLSCSSLGSQCKKLSIAVENRACILDLVDAMINLRALHVRRQDNKWNGQTMTTEDELVKWLQHRLPSTYTISKN